MPNTTKLILRPAGRTMIEVGNYVRCTDRFGEVRVGRVMDVSTKFAVPAALVTWLNSLGQPENDWFPLDNLLAISLEPVKSTVKPAPAQPDTAKAKK